MTGLSVQAGDASGELHVSWDPHPNGPVDYRVKWARVGTSFKKISETDWNAFPVDNELTVSGLWPGESYKVQVRARFSGPNGQWSPVVTGTAAETVPGPTKETAQKLTDPPLQPAENSDTADADAADTDAADTDAADTDAASVVWSATLTVGVDSSQPPGSGYSRWARLGALSERGLTLGGTSMRVMLIVQFAGGLYLAMDRATDTDFTLTLGDADAKRIGIADPDVPTAAAALVCQAVILGTQLLVSSGLEDRNVPSEEEWATFLDRMMRATAPEAAAPPDDPTDPG